jgi:hypothetical protein
VTGVELALPGGSTIEVPGEDDLSEFFFDEKFTSLAALNTSYPNGNYAIELTTLNDGKQNISLDLTGDAYPTATRFTNYEATQAIDHTTATTLTWNPISGGTAEMWVIMEIEDNNDNYIFESPFPGDDGALNGLSTSVTIPADTFSLGESYMVRLIMINVVDAEENNPAVEAVAVYQTSINLSVQTIGPDMTPPSLVDSAPFWGEERVERNSVVTFVFDEAMDTGVQPGDAISWTGLPDPEAFQYSWSSDEETLFCYLPDGLPASSSVGWSLNPPGSAQKLRDIEGNELPTNSYSGIFQTSPEDNLSDPAVTRIELFKAKDFIQNGPTPEETGTYFVQFDTIFTGISTVASADLTITGVGDLPDFADPEGDYRSLDAFQGFDSFEDLQTNFPDGDYEVTLHTFRDGERSVTLPSGTTVFPAAPTVLNFATTQEWDSTQPFTLTWSPMPGGTSDDFIFVSIEGENEGYFESPDIGEQGALDGTATSITIPANTLPPGRKLEAELVFANVTTDNTQYPGVQSSAGRGSITIFEIQTTGDPFRPIVTMTPGQPNTAVTVTGEHGQIFDIHGSSDLLNWSYLGTVWLYDDQEGFKASGSLEDFQSAGQTRRFYQIEESDGN